MGQFFRHHPLAALRLHLEQYLDQAVTLSRWKLFGTGICEPFDGRPRFALLTVNHSTTRYLKLLLLTLAEQSDLHLLNRIVICDNRSRDGGRTFLRKLSERIEGVLLVENNTFPNHAHGMRLCIAKLHSTDAARPIALRSNIQLCCDTDVVFRNRNTLRELARVFCTGQAAFAGELRRDIYPYPEAQASFLAVRTDWYHRRSIVPWCNHGAPAYWMQRSIWRAHGNGADFASNRCGYILHRGRAAVDAARHHGVGAYALVPDHHAHFMGIPDGQAIWDAIENRFADLLSADREPELLDHLECAFQANLGAPTSI